MRTLDVIASGTFRHMAIVILILSVFVVGGADRAGGDVTAERSMSMFYLPGGRITIKIAVTGDADSVVIKETPPPKFEIYSASRATIENGVITWEKTPFTRPRTWTYSLVVPEDATGDFVFSGTVNNVPIGGDTIIKPPVPGPGLQVPVGSSAHFPYWLYLPLDYSESEGPWPLILYLHGSGWIGHDMQDLKTYPEAIPPIMDDLANAEMLPQLFRSIVVSPLCTAARVVQGTDYWNTDDLRDFLEELLLTYPIESDRIYLTGTSMGGCACWEFASKFPERVAAIIPIAGYAPPLTVLDNLGKTPAWAFHGDADSVVPVRDGINVVEQARSLGGDVTFTVYPGEGHGVWVNQRIYLNPEIYEWLLRHEEQTVRSGVPFWELY